MRTVQIIWYFVVLIESTHALLSLNQQGYCLRTLRLAAMTPREIEIRQKIRQLKKKQKTSSENDDDDEFLATKPDYSSKIQQKLGARKSKMLGFDATDNSSDDDYDDMSENTIVKSPPSNEQSRDADDDPQGDSLLDIEDDDLTQLVAEKLQAQRDQQRRQREDNDVSVRVEPQQPVIKAEDRSSQKITTGIGGNWQSDTKQEAQNDVYQPKTGSWGAFPRPRDISKAYGGGRRVGPGYSNEQARAESVEETRARLQQYRQKVGIEVESEKEHSDEINEALNIGTLAMQRGMYSTAVNALEKVTQYCSTNSKLGGKVFIELGMAYEAAGRTSEAITVYTSLTKSRMEQTKSQAKRLLYGIEAIQFMRDNVNESAFSRKRASSVFIDTTGLANIASQFDDVYETAYVDLSQSFYKKLTESVVRSTREARQIVLQATGPGQVERLRIVQALRSLSRSFAEALQNEIDAAVVKKPVAFIDGKPIMASAPSEKPITMEDFNLIESKQMLENLDGEWRLQLIADKRGDGVKFFNTTLAWQTFDTNGMTFRAVAPQGFLTVQQTGQLMFNGKRRILRRTDVDSSTGAGLTVLADLLGGSKLGALGAIRTERQVILVDSLVLITRGVPNRQTSSDENEKDFFAVWRRVDRGTYSSVND